MNELTPAQNAVITAVQDFEISISSHNPRPYELARHAAITALAPEFMDAKALIEATVKGSDLFMAGRQENSIRLSAKGREAAAQIKANTQAFAQKVVEKKEVAAPVKAAPARSNDSRRLIDSYEALSVGSLFMEDGVQMIVTGHSERNWFLSSARIEADGLWDLEDAAVTYEYYRPATAEEVDAVVTTQEAAPVTAEEVREYVNLHGNVTTAEEGEALLIVPSFERDGGSRLTRTGGRVQLTSGGITLSVRREALPARLQQGVTELPALFTDAAEELETL